jgi:hypothetical protein
VTGESWTFALAPRMIVPWRHGLTGEVIEMKLPLGFCRRSGTGRFVLTAAVVIASLGFLARVPTAEAGKGWCRSDPVVIIDGQIADVFVGSTLDALITTTGPIRIVVTVPPGTSTTYVISDLGFGHGYDFSFAESPDLVATDDGVPVNVDVYVPATKDSLPVSVFFAPRLLGILRPASADGYANSWVSVSSHM